MTRSNDPVSADLHDPVLERLGEGADLTPPRRRALVDRIVRADGPARPPRSRFRAWYLAAAAVAAVIVASAALWPARPEPIPPTDIVGDLFGPLPGLAETPDRLGPQTDEASPLADALATVWGDFEGPLAIASQVAEAPRALMHEEPTEPAPAGEPDATEEN